VNETPPRPRPLVGPLWNAVRTQLAPRLEMAWGELVRTTLEWSAMGPAAAEGGDSGPCWEGPLEPFDESLRVELSPRLCQGVLGRMLGAAETGLESGDRRGARPSWGRLELQLLERLAVRAAVEFCGVLHEVSGLPLTIPCLWPVSIEGTAPQRGTTGGFPGRGLGAGVVGLGNAPVSRRESGPVVPSAPPDSVPATSSPAAVWRVQVTGTGLAGVLTFGLPPGVVALLEETREGHATSAAEAGTVTAEVVLAEVELPAAEVWNLEVGDVIPLGREPGREGETVYLDVPGVGRWPGVVILNEGVMEFRPLPPTEPPPNSQS